MSSREVFDPVKLHWDALEFSEVRPGIASATQETEQLTATVYVYEPGSVWETHSHAEDQVTFVHRGGEIVFTIDGEEARMRPGDLSILPSGVPHSAIVPADGEQVVTINVWRRRSPAR